MTSEQEQNNSNKPNADMASALNALATFEGTEVQDASQWLQQAFMIAKFTKLDESDTFRLVFLRLRNTAQSWASQTLANDPTINLPSFASLFNERFNSTQKAQSALENFLSKPTPSTKEEFLLLLKEATLVFEKNCINCNSLIKMIIIRSPDTLKPILYQEAAKNLDWYNFLKIAEECCWISFPKESKELFVCNKVQEYGKKKKFSNNKSINNSNVNSQNFCRYHGSCNHDTRNCRILNDAAKRGFDLTKNARNKAFGVHEKVENETTSSSSESNKMSSYSIFNNFIYHNFSNKIHKNFLMFRCESIILN